VSNFHALTTWFGHYSKGLGSSFHKPGLSSSWTFDHKIFGHCFEHVFNHSLAALDRSSTHDCGDPLIESIQASFETNSIRLVRLSDYRSKKIIGNYVHEQCKRGL